MIASGAATTAATADANRSQPARLPLLRRMRPLLGTWVELRIEGIDLRRAGQAIERAFAEVAAIHRLMSFHETGSELSRLHRARAGELVAVDARTRTVLECALRVAEISAGRFDPTVAAQQVAWGLLPRPSAAGPAQPDADWRDIELVGARHVRLARPLWIDLGGIAKGYAVDRALEILADAGATQVCVNAGGDLRVAGMRVEAVHLRTHTGIEASPALELADAALATSAGTVDSGGAQASAAHVHGCTRRAVGAGRVVGVVAARCMVADALTKVVIAGADELASHVLGHFNAQACVLDAGHWSLLGAAA